MTEFDKLMDFYGIPDGGLRERLRAISGILNLSRRKRITCEQKTEYGYCLVSGIVRNYIDCVTRVITDSFAFRYGEMIVSPSAAPEQDINVASETVTDCTLISFRSAEFSKLLESSVELQMLYNHLLSQLYYMDWSHKNALYLKTAQSRYRWFAENYPGLIGQVKHVQIASFLNMTPETFCAEHVKTHETT